MTDFIRFVRAEPGGKLHDTCQGWPRFVDKTHRRYSHLKLKPKSLCAASGGALVYVGSGPPTKTAPHYIVATACVDDSVGGGVGDALSG